MTSHLPVIEWEYHDQNDEEGTYTYKNSDGETLTENRKTGRYTITDRSGKTIDEGDL